MWYNKFFRHQPQRPEFRAISLFYFILNVHLVILSVPVCLRYAALFVVALYSITRYLQPLGYIERVMSSIESNGLEFFQFLRHGSIPQ